MVAFVLVSVGSGGVFVGVGVALAVSPLSLLLRCRRKGRSFLRRKGFGMAFSVAVSWPNNARLSLPPPSPLYILSKPFSPPLISLGPPPSPTLSLLTFLCLSLPSRLSLPLIFSLPIFICHPPPPSSPPLRFHFYNCCRAFHSRNTSEACQQGIMFLTMHCYRWGGHGHRRCGQRRCLALASPRHRRRRRFPEYYRVHTCVRKKKHPAIIHPPDRPRFRFHPPFIR